MSEEANKQKILEFIKTQPLGVISTISPNGQPQGAVVGIAEHDDLSIIFGTFNHYRKFRNIKHNPRVSFVIGWKDITVQYEGLAEELIGAERDQAVQSHTAKIPSAVKFAHLPEQTYFRVKPTWIKYTDYSNSSLYGEVFEVTFS
jgi:pyridoxine/pyridoxamine 5'-phosphate oxidase